jgi:CRISPR-associated protein Cmr2
MIENRGELDMALNMGFLWEELKFAEGLKEKALGNKKPLKVKDSQREWQRSKAKDIIQKWMKAVEPFLELFGSPLANIDWQLLPQGSWGIELHFTLSKPFISKDDSIFHLYDENPVSRDKILRLPLIKSTTWKGNLRYAFRQEKLPEEIEKRLFGHPKGTERSEEFQSGNLYFYPTIFSTFGDKSSPIGFDVITPLEREKRIPVQKRAPIIIECVPAGAKGVLNLLHVPLTLLEEPMEELKRKVEGDLKATVKAIKAMMLTYGFSAKKAASYGMIKPEVEGNLWTNSPDIAPQLSKEEWKQDRKAFLHCFSNLDDFASKFEQEA